MKTIRFAELVKQSGRPEAVTLWTKPEDNPLLSRAIERNRVLTVIQEPATQKKDYGLIGFHLHQHALYLVYPRPLPKAKGEVKVVGVRYDLLKELPAPDSIAPKPSNRYSAGALPRTVGGKIPPKPASVEPKRFFVTVLRSAEEETKIEVTAKSMADAESQAERKLQQIPFAPREVQVTVKAVELRTVAQRRQEAKANG